ncbi:MAG TPA: RluA family pseudouridine synthase [Chlamydiales bacterium]|nr:RluA family pseudouridine synthase [Chlamydiales bacterium]
MKKKVEKDQLLLEVLEGLYPDSSGRTLKNWLQWKRVKVDGTVITIGKFQVKAGQEIEIGRVNKFEAFPILFEDDHLVIIDKPVGLLSVPLDYGNVQSAFSLLRNYYKKPLYIVHRIDRETSGVLVFAKSRAASYHLDELFMKHDLIREYQALVEGQMSSNKGTWKSYLKEISNHEVISVLEEEKDSSLAITHYEVVKNSPKCTHLRLILETGKKHQIRVHCKDAGHPVVGDVRYGSTMNPYRRLCLFAKRIAFSHPITKKTIDIESKSVPF